MHLFALLAAIAVVCLAGDSKKDPASAPSVVSGTKSTGLKKKDVPQSKPVCDSECFDEQVSTYASSVQHTQEKIIGAYKRNVILDTDMGWDDVTSLALLIKNPNVNLLGVCVTGLGEAHLDAGMNNARRILDEANLWHVPVVPGATWALSDEGPPGERYSFLFPNKKFRQTMDTLDFGNGPLLDKLGFPKATPMDVAMAPMRAWEWMAEALNTNENQITIISIGGLTDIELLFRQKNTKFENIERIVIMGGAVDGVDGNVASLNNVQAIWDQGESFQGAHSPEWNLFLDPIAAQLVFENRKNIPLVLVPLNACNHVLLGNPLINMINNPDRISQLIRGVLEGEIQKEGKLPIFDPLATLIAIESVFDYSFEKKWIAVQPRSSEFDQQAGTTSTIAYDPRAPNAENYFRNVKIITTASSYEFGNAFSYLINMPTPGLVDVITNHAVSSLSEATSVQAKLKKAKVKKNVALLVFDKIELLDYAGVAQVFDSARNAVLVDGAFDYSSGEPAFNVFTVADPRNLNITLGMTSGDQTRFRESKLRFHADYSFDSPDLPHIDVLVVLGGQGIDAAIAQPLLKSHVDFIRRVAPKADYVVGVCSGVLLLANTGLLNNLEVTTHHTRFAQLQDLSDANNWKLRVMDTRLGRNYIHNPISKFMTSGGVHCAMAAALYVVGLYMGTEQKRYIADDVMEYQVPVGDFVYPTALASRYAYNYDPRSFIKGFSHINVIVPDRKTMEEATEFYRRTLGFQEAWSVWLLDEANEHFAIDAGLITRKQVDELKAQGKNQPVRLLVRFLIQPNIQMHIELMMYVGIDELHPKPDPTFLNTYDAGGIRHVALEVDDAPKIWKHLRTFSDIDLLQKESVPEKLTPDAQTFFYFRDPYGVQWEFEEGRPIGLVVKGVVG